MKASGVALRHAGNARNYIGKTDSHLLFWVQIYPYGRGKGQGTSGLLEDNLCSKCSGQKGKQNIRMSKEWGKKDS